MRPEEPEEFYLDKNVRACKEESAELVASERGSWNRIRAYNPMIGTLAEAHCEERTPAPIGKVDIGTEKELAGLTFTYETDGCWRWESPTCKIEILPRADIQDTEEVLQMLKPIQTELLARGITGSKITFQVGIEQPEAKNPRLADAIADERLVRLPTSSNNSRILAVGAQKGAHISLKGVILHEIGHILAPLLAKEIRWMGRSLEKGIGPIAKPLREISPHYLAPQGKEVGKNLQILKKLEGEGKETIRIGKETWDLHLYKNHLIDHFIQELSAEVIRARYLEPCLGRNLIHSARYWIEKQDSLYEKKRSTHPCSPRKEENQQSGFGNQSKI
jgi:hypothetical protein